MQSVLERANSSFKGLPQITIKPQLKRNKKNVRIGAGRAVVARIELSAKNHIRKCWWNKSPGKQKKKD